MQAQIDRARERDGLHGTHTADVIAAERAQREGTLRCIPSEAHMLPDVQDAIHSFGAAGRYGSYDEGEVERKYYEGTGHAEQAEKEAKKAVLRVIEAVAPGAEFEVNVQPLSGANANLGVYARLLDPGDKVMSLELSSGGHLSHFSAVHVTGAVYDPAYYEVADNGRFDFDALERQIAQRNPKLIVVGGSAIPQEIDFAQFAEICHRYGCLLLADISHTAGHIFTGNLSNSPLVHGDVVTSTLHKMGGPKSAVILTRKEVTVFKSGREKPLPFLTRTGLFPGVQGGPDSSKYLGIKTLFEALLTDVMRGWSERVLASVQNVQAVIRARAMRLVAESNTHLILWDVEHSDPVKLEILAGKKGKGAGKKLSQAAARAGIIINANGSKGDPNGPLEPGAVRIGMNGPARRAHWGPEQDRWMGNSLCDLAEALHYPTALDEAIVRIRAELDTLIAGCPIRWDIPRETAQAA